MGILANSSKNGKLNSVRTNFFIDSHHNSQIENVKFFFILIKSQVLKCVNEIDQKWGNKSQKRQSVK